MPRATPETFAIAFSIRSQGLRPSLFGDPRQARASRRFLLARSDGGFQFAVSLYPAVGAGPSGVTGAPPTLKILGPNSPPIRHSRAQARRPSSLTHLVGHQYVPNTGTTSVRTRTKNKSNGGGVIHRPKPPTIALRTTVSQEPPEVGRHANDSNKTQQPADCEQWSLPIASP